jgi:hypothetical protein
LELTYLRGYYGTRKLSCRHLLPTSIRIVEVNIEISVIVVGISGTVGVGAGLGVSFGVKCGFEFLTVKVKGVEESFRSR